MDFLANENFPLLSVRLLREAGHHVVSIIHITWANAKAYCENYRGGGYTDWRMPTMVELAGLYDANKSRPGACNRDFNIHIATELIDITCLFYWGSETQGSDAAVFEFGGGIRG